MVAGSGAIAWLKKGYKQIENGFEVHLQLYSALSNSFQIQLLLFVVWKIKNRKKHLKQQQNLMHPIALQEEIEALK